MCSWVHLLAILFVAVARTSADVESLVDSLARCLRAPEVDHATGLVDWEATMDVRWGEAAAGVDRPWRLAAQDLSALHRALVRPVRIQVIEAWKHVAVRCEDARPGEAPRYRLDNATLVLIANCSAPGLDPSRHLGPSHGWGSRRSDNRGYWVEGYLHDRAACSRYSTANASRGDFFLVAYSLVAVRKAWGDGALDAYARACWNQALRTSPRLREARGAGSLWITARDGGKVHNGLLPGWLRANGSAFVLSAQAHPDKYTQDRLMLFDPSVDIAVPPHVDIRVRTQLGNKHGPLYKLARTAGSPRPCLAHFAGKPRQLVRVRLVRAFQNALRTCSPLELEAGALADGAGQCSNVYGSHVAADLYLQGMASCDFALLPRGYACWSPRLSEAVFRGAIPVFVAPTRNGSSASKLDYWLPFSCLFDWRAVAVIIPEERVDATPEILAAISPADRAAMRRRLFDVRAWLTWVDLSRALKYGRTCNPHKEVDAFELLLLEFAIKHAHLLRRPSELHQRATRTPQRRTVHRRQSS